MRILIWCPHISLGGGVRLLQQLAPAIARHPDVEAAGIAILGGKGKPLGEAFPGLNIFELSEQRNSRGVHSWLEKEGPVLGIRGTARLRASVKYRLLKSASGAQSEQSWHYEQLQQAARGYDVVYCFWPHHIACPQLDKPFVCTYQDTTLIDFPELLGGIEAKQLKDLSVSWIEKATVVVSSQATKDNLVRLFGQGARAAHVIHHAILPDGGTASVRRTDLVESLPREYLILPAHLSLTKNHHGLLEAWARFERRRESALVFLGPHTQWLYRQPDDKEIAYNWHMLRLIGQIARHQLQPDRDFYALGYVEDESILPLIKNAKALIMPTLAEGGGSYPVEEALSVGTPVLCSDIPVMREHLRERSAKIGWFDPYSVDSILRSLNDLFQNYGVYKQSALKGMSDPRPTWDDVAAQYVEVFKRALQQ